MLITEEIMGRMGPAQVARIFGRSPDWLKMLERLGVIPRARRDFSGYRFYLPGDVEEIRRIVHERAAGRGTAEREARAPA